MKVQASRLRPEGRTQDLKRARAASRASGLCCGFPSSAESTTSWPYVYKEAFSFGRPLDGRWVREDVQPARCVGKVSLKGGEPLLGICSYGMTAAREEVLIYDSLGYRAN